MTSSEKEISIPVHEPNLKEKIFFLFSGILTSVTLTLFIGNFTDTLCIALPILYANICSIAIFTPFVEELSKAYPLFYRHGETTRSLFTLGFFVGLGFGFTEFLLYVFALNQPILLRLPAIIFHAASTSITAYGIGTKRPLIFYLTSVALHFAINFASIFSDLWIIVGPTALSITFLLSWILYKKT